MAMVGRRWALPVSLAVVLSFVAVLLPSAVGNHPQVAHGDAIVFDHKTGNEWWVEAVLSGGAAGSVSGVQAMDTGGAWVPLSKRSWGAWAASFHIEPGHQVRFRATWSGGDVADSCWFTHPAGTEQCGSTTTTTTTTTSSSTSTTGGTGFDATFTGVRGNEWWVQAQVATNGPSISKVDVRLNGGAWQPMTKQSWGWGASYHIVQGTIVQLRATATTGATDLSSCRQWIPASGQDAAIVSCSSTPQPGGVTFSGVRGNNWWAEVAIRGTAPINYAVAVFDCDPNRDPSDMAYHADWGKYALGGTYIPDGTRVTFEASGEFTGTARSQGYIWPSATPTSGCPAPPAWPVDGSTAEYRLYHREAGESLEATLRLTFVVPEAPFAANWEGECTITHTAADGRTTTWTADAPTHPPVETRTPRVGFTIGPGNQPSLPALDVENLSGQTCFSNDGRDWSSTTTGTISSTTKLLGSNGQPRTMTLWNAQNADGSRHIHWETNVGLVLHWNGSDPSTGAVFGGDLVRTDAPV